MSIHLLVTGILHKDPVSRTSQNGNPYATFTLRVEQDGQTVWVNAICFDEVAQAELSRLSAGDAVSIQGKGVAKVYMKDDEARPSLQVTASAVLPLQPKHESKYRAPAKTKAKAAAKPASQDTRYEDGAAADGFDDPLDF